MQIIIIAWRFNPVQQKNSEIIINEKQKIILFFTPVSSSDCVSEENVILLETSITDKKCQSENRIFVFLHQSQFDLAARAKYSKLESENCHLFLIASGEDEIYKLIDIGNAKIQDSLCNENIFNKIWKYYEILTLENIKKKIINLLLPLAIDVQGISDAEDNKKTEYLREVLNEFNYNDIFDKLKKIIDESQSIQHLMPNLEFDSLKNYLYNLSINDFNNNAQAIIEGYFSLQAKLFLPNWLKKTISDLDKNINPNK